MDVAEPMYLVKDEHGKDVPKFHVMKKLIQTYIPEGKHHPYLIGCVLITKLNPSYISYLASV